MTIKIERGKAGESKWVMFGAWSGQNSASWIGANSITALLKLLARELTLLDDPHA